ncbi:MAG TPA: DUF3352 domain-containing protein, partial [Solirubrobacterales bacterium]|nr:DUF3352 domain-containing protein [Solirubrobacterales bacterium]
MVGCGSGGSSSAGSSSELAEFASPGSLVFVEANLKPKGELKSGADSIANKLTGEASLRDFVVSQLESAARDEGESLDFAAEVEPWLGDRGAVAFERVVKGDLSEPLIVVQTTSSKAAQAFVDKSTARSKDPSKDASYDGVDFKVGGPEDDAVGVIGEALVLAGSEKEFKDAIDASKGESLGGEDSFQSTIELASSGSLADVYVDVGGFLDQSRDDIDPQARSALESSGIDPNDATAVASVIPHSDQVEIDVNGDFGGEKPPSGDASKLLGSLPAGSLAAFASSGFGEQLEEAIDRLDEEGVPPDLKPGELKSAMSRAGIDLDAIASSLQEAAIFAEGNSEASLKGALVVTSESEEAAKAIAGLGTLLRTARVPGVTAISGKASGFSVRSDELGEKPLVVVGKGDRVAIGYSLAPALAMLDSSSGATLASAPSYKAAVAALGKTPISGFVDGPAALSLAEALVPRSKTDFWEAVPYLKKISYIGIGSGEGDESPTATLIAGVGK